VNKSGLDCCDRNGSMRALVENAFLTPDRAQITLAKHTFQARLSQDRVPCGGVAARAVTDDSPVMGRQSVRVVNEWFGTVGDLPVAPDLDACGAPPH
jgi:hypothetical protein